jgi:polar amino acid transport system permease protein
MEQFQEAFFSPYHFRVSLPLVWDGFTTNLKLMFLAEAIVLVLALVVAIVRGLPGRVAAPFRWIAIVYTDVFRGTPLILVVFVVGFGFPALNVSVLSDQSIFVYGVVALVLVYTAYVTEVYRAGIDSVHPSQRMAARSLGLTYTQAMRYVVLPQAIRRVVPPLLNDFIGLQKDTALITVIALAEAVLQAQNYSTNTFNFTGYTVAAVFFIMVTIPLTRYLDHILKERELRERAQLV